MGGPLGVGAAPSQESEGFLYPSQARRPSSVGRPLGRRPRAGRECPQSLALPRNPHAGAPCGGLSSGPPGQGQPRQGQTHLLPSHSSRHAKVAPSSSLGGPPLTPGFISGHANDAQGPIVPAMGVQSGSLRGTWGPSARGPASTWHGWFEGGQGSSWILSRPKGSLP